MGNKPVRRNILWLKILILRPMSAEQDALKKLFALMPCVSMIRAANKSAHIIEQSTLAGYTGRGGLFL